MLDLKRVVALREVARVQSFSAAASELSLTQSAVSQQVAALEKQLGVLLLDRGPPVELTKAGQMLVERAGHALAHLSAAEAELTAFRGLEAGRLRIGCFASAASGIMPEALRRFRVDHSDVQISLRQLEPHASLDALRRGDLDIALTHRYSIEPDPGPALALREQYLFDEDVLVALPASHPMARAEVVVLSDLAGDLWIEAVNAGISLKLLAETATTTGFRPGAEYEGDDFTTVLELVAADAGVALVPRLAIREAPDQVVFRPVAPEPLSRAIYAARLETGIRAPAIASILDILMQIGREITSGQKRRRSVRAA